MDSRDMRQAFESFYGFSWMSVNDTAQQAWAAAWEGSRGEALDGPHDVLAEDLIKGLVDLAQSLGSDERTNILLLAAASRIRRQEAKLESMTKGADKRLVRADGSQKRAQHFERGV